jgi:hypothetical protein
MTPIIRGEHAYDTVEGDDERPAKIKINRLDKDQLDLEEIEEIMGKLRRVFPPEQFKLTQLGTDSSGEDLSVTVGFTGSERKKRGAGLMKRLTVPRSEVDGRLQK